MEAKNMAGPENARQGLFFRTTARREPVVHVVSRPDVAPPVFPERKRPPTKKSLIRRLAQNLAVRIALAGTALAGTGYAVYQEIPAVHQAIDQQLLERTGLKTQEVPSIFDNTRDKGVIEDNNIVKLSISEIQNLPSSDENGKPIFLFPLVPQAGEKIEYIKQFQGGLIHPGIEIDSQTTRNLMNLKVPAGTILNSPMDGRVFIGVDYRGTKIQNIVSIEFMGEDGLLYHFFVAGEGLEGNILQTQVNAPKRSEENNNGKEWEKGLPIAKGQKLATTTKDADFSMLIFGGLNGTFYGPKLEGNLQFMVDSSGKLVSSQS